MPRSIWKTPFSNSKIFKTLYNSKKNQVVVLWYSDSLIFPSFVGCTFSVYNGKNYVSLFISENMVGYHFKNFITTKKRLACKKSSL